MTRIVDVHTFVGRWLGVREYSSLRGLLKSMKAAGISKSVVITTNRNRNLYVYRIVREFPKRLSFAFWYDPLSPTSLSSLERMVEKRSMSLVKFHPSHTRTRLDSPLMVPLLKLCESKGIPILVHCGRWQEMAGFGIVLSVAKKYDADFLLAHMGGVTRKLRLGAIEAIDKNRIQNAFLVTSGPISRSPGNDILSAPGTCPPDILELAVRRLGSRRVLFGSDFPFGLQAQILASIRMAHLTNKELRDILSDNAKRLIRNLDESG